MALLTVVSDGARVGRVTVRRQRGVGLHLLLVHHGSVRLQALLSFSCSSCNRMFQLGSVGRKRGPEHEMASASVVLDCTMNAVDPISLRDVPGEMV